MLQQLKQQQGGQPILIGNKQVTIGKPLQIGGKPLQLIGKGGQISLIGGGGVVGLVSQVKRFKDKKYCIQKKGIGQAKMCFTIFYC